MSNPVRHALVTGGCGFVLAPTVRRILAAEPATRVTVVDRGAPDALVRGYLGEAAARVEFRTGDLRDAETFRGLSGIDHVVHGAAATLDDAQEWDNARTLAEVNVGGTLQLLDWVRRQPEVRRLVHVSSGAVYGDVGSEPDRRFSDEEGPVEPRSAYGITKAAGEQLALRFAELQGRDVRVARVASVFGPMERPTGSRAGMSPVYRMTHAFLDHGTVTVSRRSLTACVAPIASEDVAAALAGMLASPRLRHTTYNVASGYTTTVAAILDAYADAVDGFAWEPVDDPAGADVDFETLTPLARAHVNRRLLDDVPWRPQALGESLRAYVEWVRADAERRSPPASVGR